MSNSSNDRSVTSLGNDRRNAPRKLIDPIKIREVLEKNRWLWIAPTVAFTALGFLYAVTKSSRWQASQALIVRDEAIGEVIMSAGRFDNADSLKRSLETILQVAKNQQVVVQALRNFDPKRAKREGWPSDVEIEATQKNISVTAPKGTEFGTSEVIYLNVEHRTAEKALALHRTLSDALEAKLQELRDQRLKSVVDELTQNVRIAEGELEKATKEVATLEQKLGSDLGELLTMTDQSGSSGDSNLRSQFNQIKNEIRQAEGAQESRRKILDILLQTENKAEAFIAMPNSLLESQPALRRLKDGLVEAQLRTARLRGSMTDDHPRVQAALLNEQNILTGLQQELSSAITGLQADLKVSENVLSSLVAKFDDVHRRLDGLAGVRAKYENMIAAASQKRQRLQEAQAALSEARARQEAVGSTSLISRLDEPVTGSGPMGPGRLTILFGSSFGGLLVGLSLVYLIAPWQSARAAGRRATDQAQRTAGRRTSDLGAGKDESVPEATPALASLLATHRPKSTPPAVPDVAPTTVAKATPSSQQKAPKPSIGTAAEQVSPEQDNARQSPMELFRQLQANVPPLDDSKPFDYGSPRDSQLIGDIGQFSIDDDGGERELERISSIISQTLDSPARKMAANDQDSEYPLGFRSDEALRTMVCDVEPTSPAPGTDTDPSLSNLINLLQYRPSRDRVPVEVPANTGRNHG